MAFTPFVLPATPFHRMRLVATLLLVVMAAVFVAALVWQRFAPGLIAPGYIRAVAEASLVGGLADWFAVTALFRHPLGLPIPHTAIIPTNKDRIGDSLAAFLKDNFLTPAVLARRLEGLHVAAAIAGWLTTPRGTNTGASTGRLRRALAGLALRFVAALDDATVAQLLAVIVTDRLRSTPVAPVAGRFFASLVADGRHEALIERAVIAGLDLLDAHAGDIHAAVAERSGKWVPAFVDEKIAGGIVDAVRARLLAMSEATTALARRDQGVVMADFRARAAALEMAGQRGAAPELPPPPSVATALGRAHPDRVAITAWLTRIAAELQDPASSAAQRFEAAKLDLLDSPATAGLFASLWDTVKTMIAGEGREATAHRAGSTSQFAAELGGVITANPALADALDTLARRALVSVVATYGSSIVRLVSDTIRAWDAATVTGRLEAAVGRDLQYIRINGTVIGGLIGFAIHAVERAV